MENSFKTPQLLLRFALGITFLTPVSDRLGILGPMGERNIEWGNWNNFIDYTTTLMPFLDRPAVNIMGSIATIAEIVIGILLIVGYKTKYAAIGGCILTLIFILSMTVFKGIKAPINYAVFVTCTSSLFLSRMKSYEWSLDQFMTKSKND
ncbi:DoxX family protein [Chryseobacterium sp. ERMR1:04]|uniref:DoxX family protein n=1 Tax=Chryseobacterium sp. ERMR1:04 TaxID=1705393 RepID=UPI0006C86052|nr:DoxX family protein [Chryseobacterium sp. ERMR1:04]KPH14193.1 hypothetical protein AMQ68_01300 [Chryseobacterium sp. ERMR1:04]